MAHNAYLGRTFECCNNDEVRLAVNLICQGLGEPELNDKQFEILIGDTYYYLGLGNGNVYIGVLEAVS